MRTSYLIALLSLSMAGTTMAQQTNNHLVGPGKRNQFNGTSHIEVELGQKNALVVGFNTFAQVQARKNIDSLLRLFIADYQRVIDTNQHPLTATHALVRLDETSRTIRVRHIAPPTTSYRFTGTKNSPVLVKTQQDTVQLVWSSAVSEQPYYDFSIYLMVNSLADIEQLLQAGGVNSAFQGALKAVREYKGHDLTNPKMAFNLVQRASGESRFIHPGLAKSPYISLHVLGIGVGLIRNQWVPSFNPSLEFIPNRLHGVGYSVGYLSNFFFSNTSDGSIHTQRNDFLTLGVSFYKRNTARGETDFTKFRAGFSVGLPTYRSGDFFARNTIRLSGEIALSNIARLQPEIYMNGFFRQVFPGVRVSFGL